MTQLAATPEAAETVDVIGDPWARARRRFLKNRLAVVGGVILILLMAACFCSLPYTLGTSGTGDKAQMWFADQRELAHVFAPPGGAGGLLGADDLGRDLLSRMLLGGAISLSIGLTAAAISVAIGTSVGLIAGYAGGRTDAILMRIVDVLYGLPYILLVILLRVTLVPLLTGFLGDTPGWFLWMLALCSPVLIFAAVSWAGALFFCSPAPRWWGYAAAMLLAGVGVVAMTLYPALQKNAQISSGVLVLLVGIGSVSWLTMARVIRGQVLSLRDQPFVEAARAIGLPPSRILLQHILPNLVGPIVVYATMTVPQAILAESFLSFLGLGIQAPLPTWGSLASDGVAKLNPVHIRWWLIAWPCIGLSLTLLCLNFVGDGLRDALDPKGR